MKPLYLFLFALIFIFCACEKETDYSPIPEIQFKSFSLEESTDGFSAYVGILNFEFMDGDGNLGTNSPNDTTTQDSILYDLFIHKYSLSNGSSIESNYIQKYRLPVLQAGQYYKYISGTIDIEILYPTLITDTIQYGFYIVDRDNNPSNYEFTDSIIFNNHINQ